MPKTLVGAATTRASPAGAGASCCTIGAAGEASGTMSAVAKRADRLGLGCVVEAMGTSYEVGAVPWLTCTGR